MYTTFEANKMIYYKNEKINQSLLMTYSMRKLNESCDNNHAEFIDFLNKLCYNRFTELDGKNFFMLPNANKDFITIFYSDKNIPFIDGIFLVEDIVYEEECATLLLKKID